MPRFADFDSRGYRTVDVRTGYRGWVSTYEETVEDAMDVALLDELTPPPGTRCVADTNARSRKECSGSCAAFDQAVSLAMRLGSAPGFSSLR